MLHSFNGKVIRVNIVRLKEIHPTAVKSSERFILGFELVRLYNTLTASQRSYLRICNNRSPANQRDRLEQMLNYGAIIFECVNTLGKLKTRIEDLESWNKSIPEIDSTKSQISDQHSFTRTVLKCIRNKVIFHYDESVLREIIRDYPIKTGTVLGKARTRKSKDLAFVLIDEMVLSYVLTKYKPKVKEIAAFESFQDMSSRTTSVSAEHAAKIERRARRTDYAFPRPLLHPTPGHLLDGDHRLRAPPEHGVGLDHDALLGNWRFPLMGIMYLSPNFSAFLFSFCA